MTEEELKLQAEIMADAAKLRAEVREQTPLITGETNMQEIFAKHNFVVVSFYKPSVKDSQELQDLIDDAKFYMENKMRINDWAKRDVGWYRIDMEKNPELVFYEDKDQFD